MIKKPHIDWPWVRSEAIRIEKIRQVKDQGQRDLLIKNLDECMRIAKPLVKQRSVIITESVSAINDSGIILKCGITLSGKRLAAYLNGAERIAAFAVTIGPYVERSATRYMKKNEVLLSYLLDRIGSFAVESLAQSTEDYLRKDLASKKCSVSMRYSPGYCDFPIEEQAKLNRLINFRRAGIKLNKSFMMSPNKSITAIAGIGGKKVFSKKTSQCIVCGKEDCSYKRI